MNILILAALKTVHCSYRFKLAMLLVERLFHCELQQKEHKFCKTNLKQKRKTQIEKKHKMIKPVRQQMYSEMNQC